MDWSSIERIAEISHVPKRRRNRFDWQTIESSVGRRLPDDYKQLLEIFPDGYFCGVVRLNRPGDNNYSPKEFLGFYACLLEDMRVLRAGGHHFPFPIFPEPGGLLPWASSRRADHVFWLTGDEDPNLWPVVVVDWEFLDWRERSVGACDFLIDMIEGRFDARFFGSELTVGSPSFEAIVKDGPPSTSRPLLRLAPSARRNLTSNDPSLSDLIGPPRTRAVPVDWTQVEGFMGVTLPSDYRNFIDSYGPGMIGEVKISCPGAIDGFDMYELIARVHRAAQSPSAVRTVAVCPEPGGIIAWGEADDGSIFSWAPYGVDPEEWGIVVQSGGMLTHLPEDSFTTFLRRYFEGDEDLSIIFGHPTAAPSPRFTPAQSAGGQAEMS